MSGAPFSLHLRNLKLKLNLFISQNMDVTCKAIETRSPRFNRSACQVILKHNKSNLSWQSNCIRTFSHSLLPAGVPPGSGKSCNIYRHMDKHMQSRNRLYLPARELNSGLPKTFRDLSERMRGPPGHDGRQCECIHIILRCVPISFLFHIRTYPII